jgi:hypothetical protein
MLTEAQPRLHPYPHPVSCQDSNSDPPAGSSLIILYSNNFMLDDADTHLTADRRSERRKIRPDARWKLMSL